MNNMQERISRLSPAQRAMFDKRLRGETPEKREIPRRSDPGPYRPSIEQEQVWFHHEIASEARFYHIARGYRIKGPLNVPVLRRATNEIIKRHENLRTTFNVVDGVLFANVRRSLTLSLDPIDLSAVPEDERETEMFNVFSRALHEPFDLSRGPLIRVVLVRLGEQEHGFFPILHHIITDRLSVDVFFGEAGTLYDAFLKGEPSPLPELPIQYGDFCVWQRQRLQGKLLDDLSYWKNKLADPPTLALATDRPRQPNPTHAGAREQWRLDDGLWAEFKDLMLAENITRYMGLLAVYAVLLHRYTKQEDVLIVTPISNRDQAELEPLIGYLINMIVMRIDLSGNPSFRELLNRARTTLLEALAHKDMPISGVVQELRLERDPTRNPLFQAAFIYTNSANAPRSPDSTLSMSPLNVFYDSAYVDITLGVDDVEDWCVVLFDYRTELFEPATIKRIGQHYQTLLANVMADLDRRIGEIPIMTEAEQRQLLNVNLTSFPTDCIHHLFEAQAKATPDAVAVGYENEQLTYRDLNERANQLAHYLRSLGAGPETTVAILLERSTELVLCMLAVLKAGAAYVPLDPSYPKDRIGFIVNEAAVCALLTTRALANSFELHQTNVVCIDEIPESTAATKENPITSVSPENLAYIIYTSGSTGQPKGVMVTHANVARLFTSTREQFQFSAKDVWTLFHSYAFDFSVWEIWGALLHGGRLVVVPYEVSRSPETFYELLADEKVTVLNQTPSAFQQLTHVLDTHHRELNLRLIIFGGEALEFQSLKPWFDRYGDAGPRLVNMYGITETTVHVTYRPINAGDLNDVYGSRIGPPISDLQLFVLDAYLQPAPIGVPGEIYVGGEGLARGYFTRPEVTAERFIPNTFSEKPGERLYRSGDLARWREDGDLEYVGRADQQVKVRGFRIELGEVEAALRGHERVSDAVVVAQVDENGEKRLAGYVITNKNGDLTSAALREYLTKRLPDYMIPSGFSVLDKLPLNENGKVDREALPEVEYGSSKQRYQKPRTPVEELLCGIWMEVLPVERIGIEDDFFELGGHSLHVTQVLSRVRETLWADVPLRALFDTPTIKALAQAVEVAGRSERGLMAPPIEVVSRAQTLPLSFAQQRLWFFDQLYPGNAAYNVSVGVRLIGQLKVAALERALNEIVRRHEVLRTAFAQTEGQPAPVITPDVQLNLTFTDLSNVPADEQEARVEKLATAEAQHPFDLTIAPLLRVALLRLSADEHVLLLTIHHIVTDGWSMGVFVNEVATLYEAFSAGRESPLPPLSIQYADYAVWQRNWLQGEVLERQLTYWKQQLEGAPELLKLPTDRPRPAAPNFSGAVHTFHLTTELSASLLELSRSYGVTLFMTLLAGFQTLLHLYTGQEDIIVGTNIANRTQGQTEELIGFFVNNLVLRGEVRGESTFSELLERTREVCLEAYVHQELPFEKLVEELQPKREFGYHPLFQVLFVLQNTPHVSREFPGLELKILTTDSSIAKFDLSLNMMETQAGLGGVFEYDRDLFDAETIAGLSSDFQALLESVVADPQLPIYATKMHKAN